MPLHFPAPFVLFDEKPAGRCELCGTPFYRREMEPGGAFEKHVMSHSHEEARVHSPRVQAPGLFDPKFEGGDVEWSDWVDRHKEADPLGLRWDRWGKTSDGKS